MRREHFIIWNIRQYAPICKHCSGRGEILRIWPQVLFCLLYWIVIRFAPCICASGRVRHAVFRQNTSGKLENPGPVIIFPVCDMHTRSDSQRSYHPERQKTYMEFIANKQSLRLWNLMVSCQFYKYSESLHAFQFIIVFRNSPGYLSI